MVLEPPIVIAPETSAKDPQTLPQPISLSDHKTKPGAWVNEARRAYFEPESWGEYRDSYAMRIQEYFREQNMRSF